VLRRHACTLQKVKRVKSGFCSGIARHIKNLRGIEVWCWYLKEQETTEIEKGRIIWHIGDRCRNIFAGGIAINPSTDHRLTTTSLTTIRRSGAQTLLQPITTFGHMTR
jgi:hypothetical protein